MKTIKIINKLKLMVIAIVLLLSPSMVKADGMFLTSETTKIVNVGDEITYKINISRSDPEFSKINAILGYDNEVLEFVSITEENVDKNTVIEKTVEPNKLSVIYNPGSENLELNLLVKFKVNKKPTTNNTKITLKTTEEKKDDYFWDGYVTEGSEEKIIVISEKKSDIMINNESSKKEEEATEKFENQNIKDILLYGLLGMNTLLIIVLIFISSKKIKNGEKQI